MADKIGDLMKDIERRSMTISAVPSTKFLYARVDGRHFHTWVKSQKLSFADPQMFKAMIAGMNAVAKDLDADIGYTQSDECSFGWFAKANPQSQMPFDGKVMKLNSVISSVFTGAFIESFGSQTLGVIPSFDCRIVEIDTKYDFQTMFYWRYLDAKRNAVNGFARQHFSHKRLQGMSLSSVKEMINDDGKLWREWDNMPPAFTEGVFYLAPKHTEDGNVYGSKEQFKQIFEKING